MEAARKALVVVAVLGAGAGVGSILFALVTPGELKKQSMLQVETTGGGCAWGELLSFGLEYKHPSCSQEMPERDSRRRDEAIRTKELVMATLKDAAATKENVAWRRNWRVSGDGRSA